VRSKDNKLFVLFTKASIRILDFGNDTVLKEFVFKLARLEGRCIIARRAKYVLDLLKDPIAARQSKRAEVTPIPKRGKFCDIGAEMFVV